MSIATLSVLTANVFILYGGTSLFVGLIVRLIEMYLQIEDDDDEDGDDMEDDDERDDENDDVEYIEIRGELVELDLAPILTDLIWGTDIDLVHIGTVDDAVEFTVADSESARDLVELFVAAMPHLGIVFARGGRWNGNHSPYGVQATSFVSTCDECDDLHIIVKMSVVVPKTDIQKITNKVHKYLFPHGIDDIVDVD